MIVRVEGKTRRVKVSEAIGDWKLKEIRAARWCFRAVPKPASVPLVQAKQAAGAAIARPAVRGPWFRLPRQWLAAPRSADEYGRRSARAAVSSRRRLRQRRARSAPGRATATSPFVTGAPDEGSESGPHPLRAKQ